MYNSDVGEPKTEGVDTLVMYFQSKRRNCDLKAKVYNNLE